MNTEQSTFNTNLPFACHFVGTMPFRADTVGKLKKLILAGQFTIPPYISPKCKEILKGMLKLSSSERATISDVQTCEWLARVAFPTSSDYLK